MRLRILRYKGAKPGNCYENCTKFMVLNRCSPERLRMVQAVVSGRITLEGQRIGHSWIEVTVDTKEYVYEPRAHSVIPKEDYYARAQPTCVHVYDVLETLIMLVARGYYGPWTEDVSSALHTDDPEETGT